jgi:hypothetical protein
MFWIIVAVWAAGCITGYVIGHRFGFAAGMQHILVQRFQPPKPKGDPIT